MNHILMRMYLTSETEYQVFFDDPPKETYISMIFYISNNKIIQRTLKRLPVNIWPMTRALCKDILYNTFTRTFVLFYLIALRKRRKQTTYAQTHTHVNRTCVDTFYILLVEYKGNGEILSNTKIKLGKDISFWLLVFATTDYLSSFFVFGATFDVFLWK